MRPCPWCDYKLIRVLYKGDVDNVNKNRESLRRTGS